MQGVIYQAIFDLECRECDRTPVVGILSDEGSLRCTQLCGRCFFADALMDDPEFWNNLPEGTE
jgi:hypothetical protein